MQLAAQLVYQHYPISPHFMKIAYLKPPASKVIVWARLCAWSRNKHSIQLHQKKKVRGNMRRTFHLMHTARKSLKKWGVFQFNPPPHLKFTSSIDVSLILIQLILSIVRREGWHECREGWPWVKRRVTMSAEKGDHECREGWPRVQRRVTMSAEKGDHECREVTMTADKGDHDCREGWPWQQTRV